MNVGMMLALASGLLWSVTIIIDKTLVSKHFTHQIQIFVPMSVVYVILGTGAWLYGREGISPTHCLVVVCSGLLYLATNYLYFTAAKREEISRVVPLFAISSIFVALFGAIWLGEIFHLQTYFGVVAIAFGAALIMLRTTIRELMRSHVLGIMAAAALANAIHAILVKYLLGFNNYWTVFGSITLVNGLFGLIIFSSQVPVVLRLAKSRGWTGVGLVASSETIGMLASLLFTFSASVWYVTLANAVSQIQYLFLFLGTIVVSRYRPRLFQEAVTKRTALQKIVAIAAIICGVVLL